MSKVASSMSRSSVPAGYPVEEHTVTTSDGYVLVMERIPRHGALLHAHCSWLVCTALSASRSLQLPLTSYSKVQHAVPGAYETAKGQVSSRVATR